MKLMSKIGIILFAAVLCVMALSSSGAQAACRRGSATADTLDHGSVMIAQGDTGEIEGQVPVREAVEAPDSAAADAARGNAEADMPGEPSAPDAQPPPVENPSDVQQPALEP